MENKGINRRHPAAALSAAAVLVLVIILILVFTRQARVFSGSSKDSSGLSIIQTGDHTLVDKKGERRSTLKVYAGDLSGVINPAFQGTSGDRLASSVVFEPMMNRDREGRLEAVLAKSFSVSEDGGTCEIHLKSGVKFSDGTELTAEDAAFSITAAYVAGQTDGPLKNIRGMESMTGGESAYPEGIEVKDAHTLILSFDRPSPDNLQILETRIQKKPEDLSDGIMSVSSRISTGGVGSGAYRKADQTDGNRLVLEENPEYRKKIRDIKRIEFVLLDTYGIRDAIRNFDVDMAVFNGDSRLFQQFVAGKQFHLYEKPMETLYCVAFNRMNDTLYIPAVRKAIALAVNRQGINESGNSVYMAGADNFVPEESAYTGGFSLAMDQEEAKKLLERAKDTGTVLSGRLRLPILKGNQVHEELSKKLQRDLKEIGAELEVNAYDQNEYLQQVYMMQNFDLILTSVGSLKSPAGWSVLTSDLQGLPTACNSSALSEAIQNAGKAYTEKQAEVALKELNKVCCEQVPVVPLARPKQFIAVSADLSGYKMNQYDEFFRNIYDIRVR